MMGMIQWCDRNSEEGVIRDRSPGKVGFELFLRRMIRYKLIE